MFLFWRIVAVHEGLLNFFELGTSSCSPQQIPVCFVLLWSVMSTANALPNIKLRQFVDDIRATTFHKDEDTVINNTAAKLIVVNAVEYDGVESARDSLFMYESDSRVYLWNGSEFRLMYDFSLNVGDTLITDIDTTSCAPLIVDSIFNRILDGQNLKVQHLSYEILNLPNGERSIGMMEIIEKIGIEAQFIFYPTCPPIDDFAYQD